MSFVTVQIFPQRRLTIMHLYFLKCSYDSECNFPVAEMEIVCLVVCGLFYNSVSI
jgi:hypothetical protein